MLFGRAKEEFHIEPVVSADVEQLVNYCIRAYQGNPDWVNGDDHIKTINFAKSMHRLTGLMLRRHRTANSG